VRTERERKREVCRRKVLTSKMCLIPRSFFQSFFRVLTQMSPLLATLGWKILVRKNPAQDERVSKEKFNVMGFVKKGTNPLEESSGSLTAAQA